MIDLLIIDDDKDICFVLSKFLKKHDYAVDVAHNGEEGLQLLRKKSYTLVLCDYRLPDHTGVDLLRKIKVLQSTTAVIIITGYSDVRTAVETFKYGASDYVTKPIYPDELLVTIRETIAKGSQRSAQEAGVVDSKEKRTKVKGNHFIVGKSPQSQKVQQYIELIAPSEMSVIINGETGTGKEFVALSIHQFSKRAHKPFIAIDCGALPKELAGSELFGHTKGSFTGAISDKPGSFELANGGTIFLDEIGNLSYENQVKLLRVTQERQIKRIGATSDTAIDVRIIAATNENLTVAVKAGRFREDLYHRLNEFKIELSPLRDRKDDILIFANYFLEKANESLQKHVQGFSRHVIDQFLDYYWYGNLRELNNVVKRAVLLTTGEMIQPESLPQEILRDNSLENATPNPGIGDPVADDIGLLKSIAGSAEKQAIIEVLEKVNYNKSKAALMLKIDRKTLYNKLKLYSINL
jgi:two-component system response regulator HydG